MSGTRDLLYDLADACKAEADSLQDIDRASNFSEPNHSRLGRNEINLRLMASSLVTSAVSEDLDSSQPAQQVLKAATDKAKEAADEINNVENAIKIAGLIISLAASAMTGNVPSILTSANALLQGVGPLLPSC